MEIQPKEIWIQEIEKSSGEEIMMNTLPCVIYKTDKDNCRGCSYELNCAKLSACLTLQTQMANYKPKDFLDSVKTGEIATNMIENIVSAKSVPEVEKIMRGENK